MTGSAFGIALEWSVEGGREGGRGGGKERTDWRRLVFSAVVAIGA